MTGRAAWLTLGFMLLQAAWILTIPPFRGSDEFDHAYRAAAVAGGDWIATDAASDGRGLLVEAPADLVAAARAQCSVLDYTGPDNCMGAEASSDGRVLVASGAANYFPAYYAVVGGVGQLASGSQSLYVMRVASALLCAAFVFAAAWSATRSKGTWPLRALVLASSPVLVYSTAIVAPNGLEMAAGLALWCSLIALASGRHGPDEPRLIAIATTAAAVMCLLRLLGPAFVVAIVVTVALYRRLSVLPVLRRHHRLLLLCSVVVLSTAATFAWWITGPGATTGSDGPEGATSIDPIYALLWPLQSIAAFPYRDQPGPLIVYGVVAALVLMLVAVGVRVSGSSERLVVLGACAAALLLPFAATVATADGRGVIWQGRYGLAFAVGFILLAGWAVGESGRAVRLDPRLGTAILVAYGAAVAACYLKVRSDELSENSASIADPTWWAPHEVLLVALVATAIGAFSAAVLTRETSGG
jgi:hypothetical protein